MNWSKAGCFLRGFHKDKVVDIDTDGNVILVCQRCGVESSLRKGSTLYRDYTMGKYP